jgi:hypothetical protein
MDRATILRIARSAPSHYKRSEKPKKRGGVRVIHKPSRELRTIQDRLKRFLLDPLVLPEHMMGGVRGCTIKENARAHLGAPVLVNLDLKQCFSYTTQRKVYRVFTERLGCIPDVAHVLTQLTTVAGHAPEGAPTSTGLVNLALLGMYRDLEALAGELGLEFTMWVDDITFSGRRAREAIDRAVEIVRSHGYRVNAGKKRVSSQRTVMEVTGIQVNGRTLGVTPERRAKIRDRIRAVTSSQSPSDRELRSVRGQVAHVRSISMKQGRRLERQLGSVGSRRAPGAG